MAKPRYKRTTRAQKSLARVKQSKRKSKAPKPKKKKRVPRVTKGLGRPIPEPVRQILAQPKKQLTTQELIKVTDPRVKFRAKTQSIIVMRLLKSKVIVRTMEKDGRRFLTPHIEVRLDVKGVTDRYEVHLQIPIDIRNKRKLLARYPIRVYCSCPDFKYRRAYVLKLHRNLIARKVLGLALIEPPLITNPLMRPGVCKHVLVALRWIKRRSLSWLLGKTKGVVLSHRDV